MVRGYVKSHAQKDIYKCDKDILSRRALIFIRRRDISIIKIYTLPPRLIICEFKSNVDDKKKIIHLHSFYRKEMKDVCKKKLHFIWLKIWNYE